VADPIERIVSVAAVCLGGQAACEAGVCVEGAWWSVCVEGT